jgi:thioredoxin-dependent peroxiredoxin
MLQIGDLAPDFDTVDCRGERVHLTAFRGRSKVVLFFFPRAFSPACTLEVRQFRDNHGRIVSLNAELIGVSVDKADKQCRFQLEEQLQFRLISDEARVISQAYGVVWPVLRVDRRATFIIDVEGRIEDVFHHEVQVYRHLEDVLERLASRPSTAPALPSSVSGVER